MSWEVYTLLVLAGALGGFISGLVGIGGGVIYVFVIPYALAYWHVPLEWEAQFVIANSLAAIFLGSVVANYTHFKKGYFFMRPVLWIGFAATISSWFSLKFFVNTPFFSKEIFLMFLIVLMAYMLVYTLKGAARDIDQPVDEIPLQGLLWVGVTSGIVASASGLGGGIVIIPMLNRFFGINIKKASAISLGVITLSAFVISITNMNVHLPVAIQGSIGLVIPVICLTLSLSVILTSPLGVLVAHKLSSRYISYIYAVILLAVMMSKIRTLLTLIS